MADTGQLRQPVESGRPDGLCRPGAPGPFRAEWAPDDPQTYRVVDANGEVVAEWAYAVLPGVGYADADTRDADAFADLWARIGRADRAIAYCDALIALGEWDDESLTPDHRAMHIWWAHVATTMRHILTGEGDNKPTAG